MCLELRNIKIKGVSRYSPNRSFVPCGKCVECRRIQHSSWYTRLFLELKACVAQGWRVGFITLTYNNDNLPYFDNSAYVLGKYPSSPVPCFSRRDVTNFKDCLRKHIWKNYGKTCGIKYIICSEFGEHTRRPHYHGLFCFPPNVDLRSVFDYMSRKWNNDNGFVIPRQFDQYVTPSGEVHKGFEVDVSTEKDLKNACYYAAKYVCKDLAFEESCPKNIDKSTDAWKDGKQFHIQSKSLGLSYLQSLSDSQKIDILQNGITFLGEDAFKNVPAYFKGKIIFDTYYIVDENGKRLVRKKANAFFRENFQTIFEIKKRYLKDSFSQLMDVGFYQSRGLTLDKSIELATKAFASLGGQYSVDDVASFAVSRFGTKYVYNYDYIDAVQYLIRYSEEFDPDGQVFNYYDLKDAKLMDKQSFDDLTCACYQLYECLTFSACDTFTKNERELSRLRDLYKQYEVI